MDYDLESQLRNVERRVEPVAPRGAMQARKVGELDALSQRVAKLQQLGQEILGQAGDAADQAFGVVPESSSERPMHVRPDGAIGTVHRDLDRLESIMEDIHQQVRRLGDL